MQKISVKISNLEEVFYAELTSFPEEELDSYDFNVPLSWLPQEVIDECRKWTNGGEPIEGLISIAVPQGWSIRHADVKMGVTFDRDSEISDEAYCDVSMSLEDIQALIDLAEKAGGFSK